MTSPSRRDVLSGLLGLPLTTAALSGCGRRSSSSALQGEIVGASQELGHRVRTPTQFTLTDEQCERVDVAIVGGGVAGLAAARRLKHAGVDSFVMLELEPVAGGTARSGQRGGQAFPWGAHYLPAPMKENVALVKLLDDFGAVTGYADDGEPQFAEEMLVRDPEERLFVGGRWQEGLWPASIATAADNAQLQSFLHEVTQWVAKRDGRGRRVFTLPVSACSDDAEATALDRQSFATWLDERGLKSPAFRWWVEYATRDDYGATLAQTSAWAGLFYFAARVRSQVTAPQPLLTWPEGNGWLVSQLVAGVQPHLHVGKAVLYVEPGDSQARLLAVDRAGAPHGYLCRHVIFAAPHFLAPYVLKDFPQARRRDTKEFTYGAWLVANLSLRERPANTGFEAAWDNVLYASRGLGYVSATHQRGRDQGPTSCKAASA
jgi:phytoene dehydrogenase-like protein